MGAKTRRKILFVAFVAATSIFFWLSRSWLRGWLTGKTLDELYKLLDWALWAVIAGVIVEEWALIWKGCKFLRLAWAGEYAAAFSKAWRHKGELAESIGFIVLTIGLAGELALDPLIETRQKADQLKAEGSIAALGVEARTAEAKIADAKRDAANARDDAARATFDAAQANERAKALEAQVAASQRDAEQARLAQKRIENAVAWRSLPPDTQSALAARLAALSGGTIEISWPGYDDEALGLATQFESAVKQANALAGKQLWTISDQPRLFAQAIFFGVRVNGANPEKVESVRQAFDAVAIPSREGTPIPNMVVAGPGMQIGGVEPTDVQIWVGTKPRQN